MLKGKITITINEGDYDSKPVMSKTGTWRIEGELSEDNNFIYDCKRVGKELLKDWDYAKNK